MTLQATSSNIPADWVKAHIRKKALFFKVLDLREAGLSPSEVLAQIATTPKLGKLSQNTLFEWYRKADEALAAARKAETKTASREERLADLSRAWRAEASKPDPDSRVLVSLNTAIASLLGDSAPEKTETTHRIESNQGGQQRLATIEAEIAELEDEERRLLGEPVPTLPVQVEED